MGPLGPVPLFVPRGTGNAAPQGDLLALLQSI